MRQALLFVFLLSSSISVWASERSEKRDTNKVPAQLMEFMYRLEHDSPYLNSQAQQIPERTRMRMRLRYGLAYQIDRDVRVGFQLRTGYQNNPQDPQITIGDELATGGNFPVSIERLYTAFYTRTAQFVFGKNYYPFKKYHEMYWSDWVNPSGISYKQSLGKKFELRSMLAVLQSNGRGFGTDGIFFGIQVPFIYEDPETNLRVEHNQTIHYFNEISILPNGIPSGNYSPLFYYPSVKLTQPFRRGELYLMGEGFLELKKLSVMDTLLLDFDDQRTGGCAKIGLIRETKTSHWECSLLYSYVPRFAAVDYLAQNDWASWNYRSQGVPNANLTNIQGIELMFKYYINDKINIVAKYFSASRIRQQLNELNREANDRFRIDLNVTI